MIVVEIDFDFSPILISSAGSAMSGGSTARMEEMEGEEREGGREMGLKGAVDGRFSDVEEDVE